MESFLKVVTSQQIKRRFDVWSTTERQRRFWKSTLYFVLMEPSDTDHIEDGKIYRPVGVCWGMSAPFQWQPDVKALNWMQPAEDNQWSETMDMDSVWLIEDQTRGECGQEELVLQLVEGSRQRWYDEDLAWLLPASGFQQGMSAFLLCRIQYRYQILTLKTTEDIELIRRFSCWSWL